MIKKQIKRLGLLSVFLAKNSLPQKERLDHIQLFGRHLRTVLRFGTEKIDFAVVSNLLDRICYQPLLNRLFSHYGIRRDAKLEKGILSGVNT